VSVLFVAAMMLVQAPAVQPQPAQPVKAKKVKKPQVCEYMEITGSRAKQRVCHDADTAADLSGYGVSNSLYGKGKTATENGGAVGTATGGPGGSR
jgi:hypothetical protein